MATVRIGQGYDAHRLTAGRKLILGGVRVPHERGLFGHSDADVLTHAVIDALLGALALGDIGALFPDSDPVYKNADSLQLLYKVMGIVTGRGYAVSNLDTTILAQAPKLAPHIPEMCRKLAAVLATDIENVSVKATTEERMGFTGREEGIAAYAVVLLEKTD